MVHSTVYRYQKPVHPEPHTFRLRPRDDAAQRVSQRRMIWIGHSGVGDNDGVAGEFAAMRFEKFREVCAADFLFAFDDECEIAGQGSAGFQISLDCFEMREVLAFVVG